MTLPKIEERTLYEPIISHLKDMGFDAIGETKVVKKHPDILFKINSISFVIEVKIDKPDIGSKATAQAYDYANKLGTHNIVILIYPEKFKNLVIIDANVVENIALHEEAQVLVLTDYWTESLKDTPTNIFKTLKEKIDKKKVSIDFNTIVNQIGNYVRDLNSIISQIGTEELVSEVVNELDLFSSIGDIKDKETAKRQVINLASFLIFNQLLFYHIYKRKTNNAKLNELKEIGKIKDIQAYFNAITFINYQSIYRVNILGHIPNRPDVIGTLNEVIKAIKLLRVEHITRDLAGRFFHDLIPLEVRKVLAAFYTHSAAAEILAGLSINSWDETIIDPACGSGTLLVAAYRRKQSLYAKLYGYDESAKMHKKFIEKDLTGIDIMPFAAHISSINLTTQNIEEETNVIRIATRDSLELAPLLEPIEFKENGVEITPFTETIQQKLFSMSEQKVGKGGAISPSGKGHAFRLKPSDVVIMNPPFTDREKMPKYMRDKIINNKVLGNVCGHHVNLWGYFLALADMLVKTNGKIAAVIPINIARGKSTDKIRQLLLEGYRIKYIIKSAADVAFSEQTSFIDILLIAEKMKPKKNDIVRMVILKKSIKKLNDSDVEELVNQIKDSSSSGTNEYSTDMFEIVSLPHAELLRFKENMMPILGMFRAKDITTFDRFLNLLEEKSGNKLKALEPSMITEGFHASPEGLSELTFITRPFSEDRLKRAFLILESEDKNEASIIIKDTQMRFDISKKNIMPALRTITGMNTFVIGNKMDYFLRTEPKNMDKILVLSKWRDKKKFSWDIVRDGIRGKETHMVLARRFRPDSVNTHFFAFYNEEPFMVPDTFKITKFGKDESKYQCLILNSIIGLLNIITYREQTTEGFTDVRGTDLIFFKVFEISKLTKKDQELLNMIYNKLKGVEFPCILEQLKNKFWARIELDKAILQILGFSDEEAANWIPKVYEALESELKILKELKK